jgi:hypothetical protein
MLTATGAAVDLRFMAQDTISLLDIGHHLAQINRYTGACSRPYSVAEHSLLVCDILERDGVYSASVLMAALMHDAHEAYTNDLSSPMKQLIGDPWRLEENRIQHAVLRRFGLVNAFTSHKPRIKWADNTAQATERAALLPPDGPEWEVSSTHPALTWVDFKARDSFTWSDWRQAFLDRFAELQFARSLQAKQLGAQPTNDTRTPA